MARICPECGSTVLVKSGFAIKDRERVQRYRCNRCHRIFTHPAYTRGKKANNSEIIEGGNSEEGTDNTQGA